ncbi:hypothetical protein MKS88_001118 [Plasmodium brasilianum]|uniref:Uncharacterized protein n=2 Tax=Plasmodium (Plasmodium) TaxID=418103 RepID=A0A1A8WUY4_PLAMA|nr:conserved Plasmodium protein, unknown function [Plasmodium malariae]KAI4840396.1 hypothetical protein MKS88_001118 [Plasmodium brasilianum]SBS96741.1 conserved Plasmodium protein, unknown function [Plasmodium malariae]SBT86483.1 conserved Plasmodium protein, unknown function [Plasmodium malariae]
MLKKPKTFYLNSALLLSKRIGHSASGKIQYSSHVHQKYERIKYTEEVYNMEDTYIRRVSKMNNTALTYTCEDINRKRMKNEYLWKLIYDRIKEIRNSFSVNELVVMFHAYCNSKSFDGNFILLINLFWTLLENKLNNMDYISLIALYFCAEKTENVKKMNEVGSSLLNHIIVNDCEEIKLTEKGLSIILKILCNTSGSSSNGNIGSNNVSNDNKTADEKILAHISKFIQRVDMKEIKNIMLSLHFLLKYKIFDEPFVVLLKKVQSLLIFKNINPHLVLKCLSLLKTINNPTAMQEVKSTLSIIYLSCYISSGT